MDGVVGAAHWFHERCLCKTNVGRLYCLCSHCCKDVRDYAYARARSWGHWAAVGEQDGNGEGVVARVAEEVAEVAGDSQRRAVEPSERDATPAAYVALLADFASVSIPAKPSHSCD